ncbi:terminase large subunit domain-containing protein [Rhodococcus koreensis]
MPPDLADLEDKIAALPEPERSAFIFWAKQALVRDRMLRSVDHPAELGVTLDPQYRITPAIELISRALEWATTTRRARLIITMPPQEGKSYLTGVLTVIRCLQRNPDTRIILASYAQGLAEDSSRLARNLIAQHGSDGKDPLTGIPMEDRLGLALADDKATINNWRIKGHKGGLIAVGLGGALAGKPADLLIIDDPLRGTQAADSPTERAKVIEGYRGDLTTRLSADAPVILIQTRWHEHDLAGVLLEEDLQRKPEDRKWRTINIPAVAEAHLPDALNRPVGECLVSARGRTPADWKEIRTDVGERTWYAEYQGSPLPMSGGLFGAEWFNLFRLGAAPTLYRRMVAIDPAETGKGDEAGILAAGIAENGNVILTDDWSGHYTSDQWARKGVLLALATNASELVFEAYSAATTYERVLKNAFDDLVTEAGNAKDGLVEGVRIPPERPFRIAPWTGSGNAVARSAGLRQGVSTGRCRVVGYRLATMEHQAISWQNGQHQPDRVAAATICWDHLAGAGMITLAAPQQQSWGTMPSGI